MRFLRNAIVTTLVVGTCAGAFAAEVQGKAKGRATVRDFAVMIASRTVGDSGLEASKAVNLLKEKGVPLGDVAAPLTERKMAEIMDFYGVSTRTSNPTAEVTSSRAQAAALLISPSVGAATQASRPGITPSSLDDCQALGNHGQCVNCCKALGLTTSKQCSQSCMVINKPSASEPIP